MEVNNIMAQLSSFLVALVLDLFCLSLQLQPDDPPISPLKYCRYSYELCAQEANRKLSKFQFMASTFISLWAAAASL